MTAKFKPSCVGVELGKHVFSQVTAYALPPVTL